MGNEWKWYYWTILKHYFVLTGQDSTCFADRSPWRPGSSCLSWTLWSPSCFEALKLETEAKRLLMHYMHNYSWLYVCVKAFGFICYSSCAHVLAPWKWCSWRIKKDKSSLCFCCTARREADILAEEGKRNVRSPELFCQYFDEPQLYIVSSVFRWIFGIAV